MTSATRTWIGYVAMCIGMFMAILDIQVVASSLTNIQHALNIPDDKISWIQTAYLIPEVVMIPLSGYLSRLWGTQKVFLLSCSGFILMSVAVGLLIGWLYGGFDRAQSMRNGAIQDRS